MRHIAGGNVGQALPDDSITDYEFPLKMDSPTPSAATRATKCTQIGPEMAKRTLGWYRVFANVLDLSTILLIRLKPFMEIAELYGPVRYFWIPHSARGMLGRVAPWLRALLRCDRSVPQDRNRTPRWSRHL